jgi:hypothetical protein
MYSQETLSRPPWQTPSHLTTRIERPGIDYRELSPLRTKLSLGLRATHADYRGILGRFPHQYSYNYCCTNCSTCHLFRCGESLDK